MKVKVSSIVHISSIKLRIIKITRSYRVFKENSSRASLNFFRNNLTRDSERVILYLSSSHLQTTWARTGTSEFQDQSSRVRYSRAGTATLPCPFGCNPLLSTLSYKCRCPPRRNHGRSKSDGGSPLPRNTSLCSHVRNCIFHWCNARVRYNQALRIRRVGENIPSPSNQDCIGIPRLCIRLSSHNKM